MAMRETDGQSFSRAYHHFIALPAASTSAFETGGAARYASISLETLARVSAARLDHDEMRYQIWSVLRGSDWHEIYSHDAN
jgi:hypothetical protein